MDLVQLERFIAVSRFLNFSKAAESLQISQPTLSYSVSRLEQELGTELFMRNARHVELTPAGELFLPDAVEIVRRYRAAMEKVAGIIAE